MTAYELGQLMVKVAVVDPAQTYMPPSPLLAKFKAPTSAALGMKRFEGKGLLPGVTELPDDINHLGPALMPTELSRKLTERLLQGSGESVDPYEMVMA